MGSRGYLGGYIGHYRPTEENFKDMLSFLKDQSVDLTDVNVFLLASLCDSITDPKDQRLREFATVYSMLFCWKGLFQHSSFLAGAATTGRLVARNGVLEAILGVYWSLSTNRR